MLRLGWSKNPLSIASRNRSGLALMSSTKTSKPARRSSFTSAPGASIAVKNQSKPFRFNRFRSIATRTDGRAGGVGTSALGVSASGPSGAGPSAPASGTAPAGIGAMLSSSTKTSVSPTPQ